MSKAKNAAAVAAAPVPETPVIPANVLKLSVVIKVSLLPDDFVKPFFRYTFLDGTKVKTEVCSSHEAAGM
jgi:hypothetical protein